MVSASQSVRGRACEWQVLLGAPPAAVVSGAFFCVVLCTQNCPGRCCPARRVRPIVHLFGFTRRPRKRVPAVAGRAAPSTKKLDLHGRPGLNASTVCVFSFEQSAYSKEIAQERKDTQKAQLTPQQLRGVLGPVDAGRMRAILELITRATVEVGEKRAALVNCSTCVSIAIHYFTIFNLCK